MLQAYSSERGEIGPEMMASVVPMDAISRDQIFELSHLDMGCLSLDISAFLFSISCRLSEV